MATPPPIDADAAGAAAAAVAPPAPAPAPSAPPLTAATLAAMGGLAVLMLCPVTLPVAVLKELVKDRFHVSELSASLFMSINMVAAVITAPLAGAVSDRLGKRKVLIPLALLADAALFAIMTLPVGFEVFLGLRFLEGTAHIFALSLLLALASDSAPPERRGRVMGIVGGGLTFGVALGAPLGGALGRRGAMLPLEVAAGMLIVAAVFAAVILREPAGHGGRKGSVGAIVRAIASERALLVPYAYAFVDRFTVGFFTTTFTFYCRRIHELPASRIGLLLALFLIPFSLLSYPFGRLAERTSRGALLAGGSVIYGVLCVSLGFWPASALPALMLLLGLSSAVMFVPSLVMTTDLAHPSARATAIGGFNAAGSLGFIVGPIVGAGVAQAVAGAHGWHAGYTAAFAVAGLSEIVCVAATIPALLRLRRAGRTT